MKKLLLSLALLLTCVTAQAATLVLNPPTPYPTLLGVSCGGVFTDTYATGFDSGGNPTAAVYAWTRCNQGGRGGKSILYWSWHAVTWSLQGQVLSTALLPQTTRVPDTSAQYDDTSGDTELSAQLWTVRGYVWVAELETP